MAYGGLIKVGLVGYGYAGKTFHAPLIVNTPGLALSIIASSNPAKVHADLPGVAIVADPLELVRSAELELVVIASPNDTHVPLALAALAAGKHVVVDKPFALTLADARRLVEAAGEHQRLISCFQNRRWDSDYLSIKAALGAGHVGEMVHLESHFDRFRPEVRPRWRESGQPGGGIWLDLGPHLVDQALQLCGIPSRVQASFARQRPGAQVEDWAHAVLEYPKLRIILHASMLAAGGFHRFLIHGTKGSIVKRMPDRQEAQLLAGMMPGDPAWGEDPDDLQVFSGSACMQQRAVRGDQRNFYRGIAAALRAGGRNPVTPAQILAVLAVIEAAIHSARTGVAVEPALEASERRAFDDDAIQA